MTPEELAQIQTQLKTLQDNLAAETDIKTKAMIEKQIADLKAGMPSAEQMKALNDEIKQLKTDAAKNQTALDNLIAKAQETPLHAAPQTLSGMLGKELTGKKDTLKSFKGSGGFSIEVDQTKAVGNFASATSLTGSYFVPPTSVPGIPGNRPYEQRHVRDFFPVGQTASNVIRYVRDNGGEGAPAMVAEGGTKPQIDRDLAIIDSPVRKIAVYMRLPEEMIEDIPYLQSFLTQIGMEEVMVVEDAQLFYGDGTGQNISGLFTNATAFAAGTSVVATPNQYDVLRAARKQARVARRYPNVAFVSPVDYYEMTSKKDTTANYLFLGGGNGIALTPSIDGMTIVEHTAITAGDFLVADTQAAAIFDRAGLSVRFYDQDQDNAIKNLITIVIEKRLALAIYYTNGLVKGTFATGVTDLTS